MMSIEEAASALRRGEFVLIHDSDSRENEVDMLVAAEFVTPRHVETMRRDGGGLICAALDGFLSERLGLRYMHKMLAESLPGSLRMMTYGAAPYGDHPTFSISVNHRDTYTGITDEDRARTIRALAEVASGSDPAASFASGFRTPGHVPLLLASRGLLSERQGHTEMSIYLSRAARLVPVAAICEMMDSETHAALGVEKASEYAQRKGIPLIDGAQLGEYVRVN